MPLMFDTLSQKVIGAGVEVHRRLGPGFLESVYDTALRIELSERGIPFAAQKEIRVLYNGQVVGTHVLDFLIADQLVLELKAVSGFEDIHYAQVRSYLRATGKTVGLLMNFNASKLVVKRVVLDYREGADEARQVGNAIV